MPSLIRSIVSCAVLQVNLRAAVPRGTLQPSSLSAVGPRSTLARQPGRSGPPWSTGRVADEVVLGTIGRLHDDLGVALRQWMVPTSRRLSILLMKQVRGRVVLVGLTPTSGAPTCLRTRRWRRGREALDLNGGQRGRGWRRSRRTAGVLILFLSIPSSRSVARLTDLDARVERSILSCRHR